MKFVDSTCKRSLPLTLVYGTDHSKAMVTVVSWSPFHEAVYDRTNS